MLIIHSEIRIRNCEAEVYVNDIPVVLLGRTSQMFDSRPVHQYLVPGTNEFEVLINPGLTPSHARTAHPDPQRNLPDAALTARLVGYKEGQFVDQGGEEFVKLEWSAGRSGPAWGTSLRGRSTVPTLSGQRAWQIAPRLRLDHVTLAEAEGVVRYIHHAIDQRRADDVVRLSRIWLEELSLSYPVRTSQQQIDEFKHDLFSDAASPDWRLAPLVDGEFDFRLCAGGHLIDCLDTHWRPLIRTYLGQQADMPLRMLLGRYDGVLQRLL